MCDDHHQLSPEALKVAQAIDRLLSIPEIHDDVVLVVTSAEKTVSDYRTRLWRAEHPPKLGCLK